MRDADTADSAKRYVLVMDSGVEDCFFTCMLLRRFGYSVFTALTTAKAFELMTVAPPSAVIAGTAASGADLPSRLTRDPPRENH